VSSAFCTVISGLTRRDRRHAIRWGLFPGQVQIHGRVPRCTTEMYVRNSSSVFIVLTSLPRLVCEQDIPPQRILIRRDLCKYAEEGLEIHLRHLPYPCHSQMPSNLPQSGVGAGRRGWEAPFGELRELLRESEADHQHSRDTKGETRGIQHTINYQRRSVIL
jgi:hypothetical protein